MSTVQMFSVWNLHNARSLHRHVESIEDRGLAINTYLRWDTAIEKTSQASTKPS